MYCKHAKKIQNSVVKFACIHHFSVLLMASSNKQDSSVGQTAARLIADLKRAQWLPHYDKTTLRDVVAEMGELYKHLHHNLDVNRVEASAGQPTDSRATTIKFLDTSLRRNRQCVLAYLNYRLERVGSLYWHHVGRKEELPDIIRERMDPDEMRFFRQYCQITDEYMQDVNAVDGGDDSYFIDISTDTLPPKSADIEVELIEEAMDRPSGSRFYARRQTVEPLILSGKARHINADTRAGSQRD